MGTALSLRHEICSRDSRIGSFLCQTTQRDIGLTLTILSADAVRSRKEASAQRQQVLATGQHSAQRVGERNRYIADLPSVAPSGESPD